MPAGIPESIRFETDIKPLFREKDRDAMKAAFDLWDHDDVVRHAQPILEAVKTGKMPCDGPWPQDRVNLLSRWIDAGAPP